MAEVKHIDIGKVYEIDETYVAGMIQMKMLMVPIEISGSTFHA